MTEITLQEQLSMASLKIDKLHYLIQFYDGKYSNWINEVLFDVFKMVTDEKIDCNLRKFIRDAYREQILYIENVTDICLDEYYKLVKEFNEGLNG